MRKQTTQASRFFCRQHPTEARLDRENIAELIQGKDSRLADRIARRANKLRGTRPYWQ